MKFGGMRHALCGRHLLPGAGGRLVLRPPSFVVVILAIAIFHGSYVLWSGVAMSPDSRSYAYWSAQLLASGFDYPSLAGEADPRFPALLYALFVTVLALLRLAFGEGWAVAALLLNLAAHVGLGVLVVRLAVRTTASASAGWLALALYLVCHDLLRWVPFVLSDTTFAFLAFSVFTLAAARILGDARSWLPVTVPAAAGIFYRPTGIVLLPDLVWAAYLARGRGPKLSRTVFAAIVAGGALAAAFLFAWFMQDPTRWPFQALSTAFETVARGYAEGEVVSARTETYHAPAQSLVDHVLISGDRFIHFFAIGAYGFSTAHWAGTLAFFLPCYLLAIWLGIALWRGDDSFGERERRVLLASAGAVLAYALFHALVQVDFDWRYRVPVLPHLILLASGGAADLLRRARSP